MAVYAKELTRPVTLFQNASNVAVGTPVVSSFIRLPRRDVTITKTSTTGTYTMTLDWSMDGTNVAFTTTPSLSNNTPLAATALTPYVRITITATGSNFTAHQTTVMA